MSRGFERDREREREQRELEDLEMLVDMLQALYGMEQTFEAWRGV